MSGLPMPADWTQAYTWTIWLAAAGTLQHGLAQLAARREFAPGGVLEWAVLRTTRAAFVRPPLEGALERALSAPGYLFVVALQCAGALELLRHPSPPALWALAAVVTGRLVFNLRNNRTLIGADQMQIIVLTATALAAAGDPAVQQICAWFCCLQLVLAYVTAGVWKLVSPEWRSGEAISGIVRTRSLGLRVAHEWTRRAPWLALGLGWATVLFECLAPWLVFAGPYACALFLGIGVLFHLGVAVVMGLDEFLWAYLAAYPLVLRCSIEVQRGWAL